MAEKLLIGLRCSSILLQEKNHDDRQLLPNDPFPLLHAKLIKSSAFILEAETPLGMHVEILASPPLISPFLCIEVR
jgi:hypothetical protein